MKAESYISALCFQRSKCDCQVYKRLFMFPGVKWGTGVRSREREKGWPGGDDSSAFVLHATADNARSLPDRDHKSWAGDAVPTAHTIPDDKLTVIHPAQHFLSPAPRTQRHPSCSSPSLPPPIPPPRFFAGLLPGGFAHPFLLLASCLLSLHSRLLFLWPPAHNITASLGEFLLCVFSPTLLVSLPVSVPCESPWPLPTFISSYLFPIFFFLLLLPILSSLLPLPISSLLVHQ